MYETSLLQRLDNSAGIVVLEMYIGAVTDELWIPMLHDIEARPATAGNSTMKHSAIAKYLDSCSSTIRVTIQKVEVENEARAGLSN
jgi:hypothetical protein